MKKGGFTLVELSVVLVIIGLLIGGVLVAQSMIHTAKVVTFVKQVQQYDIAVASFKKKMRTLPGDSGMMGCVSAVNLSNICDNGILEDSQQLSHTAWWQTEIKEFWTQLQAAGYNAQGIKFSVNFPPPNYTFAISDPNPNSPFVSLGKNSGIAPYYDVTTGINGHFNLPSDGGHFYLVADFTQSTDNSIYNRTWNNPGSGYWTSIPAADALAIDLKIDDGLPDDFESQSLGPAVPEAWTSHNVYNADWDGDYWPIAGKGCTYQFKYNVSQPDATCALMIRMGAQSSGV